MDARSGYWLLAAIALCVCDASPSRAGAQGWVEAISTLRASPGDVNDARLPLAERLELARTLGAYGPASETVPTLLAALRRDQDPALRDELLLAVARRAPAPAGELLAAQLADGKSPTPVLALALAEIGTKKAMQALLRALGRDEARYGVERALLRAGVRSVRPLAAALSGHSATRAARLLARLGPSARAAAPELVRALRAPGPELRAAAARALGALQATEAVPALFARLRDPVPEVVQAALLALAALGSEEHGEQLAAYLRRAPLELRPYALFALARVAPERALLALSAALSAKDAALRERALSAVEQGDPPSAAFVPLLEKLFASELREASAGALARVDEGAGMAALLRVASRSPDAAEHASRALAIGVRTFGDALSGSELDRAFALLRSLPRDGRALVLRGLARDPELVPELAPALRSKDARVRAGAAQALELLGAEAAEAVRPALHAALQGEDDAEALRRMLSAAAVLGLHLTLAELWPRMSTEETAPEAMPLAVRAVPREASDVALRVYLRRGLSPRSPARARAAAALALAALGDREALPALTAALSDASARVRLAAVHALGRLGGDGAKRAVRDRARIERDELVREAALALAGAGEPSEAPAGTRVLEVLVEDPGAAGSARAPFDVQLGDGRWLLLRPTRRGELIVAGLPPGDAEIH